MRQKGQTLVATLIVIAIMGILAVAMLKPWAVGGTSKPARADGKGNTVPGLVKLKAEDEVCRSNLGQVRLMIQTQMGGEDTPPTSLTELRGLPKEFLYCPIGKEPYAYDPTTGTVRCVHPGHEKY
jgi:hypothetical protein